MQSNEKYVIAVNDNSFEKKISEIENDIQQIQGLSFLGYCLKQQNIFVDVNTMIIKDVSQLEVILKNLNIDFYISYDISLKRALEDCPEATLKKKMHHND